MLLMALSAHARAKLNARCSPMIVVAQSISGPDRCARDRSRSGRTRRHQKAYSRNVGVQ
jgi:hypothetical protein